MSTLLFLRHLCVSCITGLASAALAVACTSDPTGIDVPDAPATATTPAPAHTTTPAQPVVPDQRPAITPVPLPTIDRSRLPRDEQGRLFGGEHLPFLNYSPTMITGEPCQRATEWSVTRVDLEPPFEDYAVVDNPCVVQNAVDDYVRTAFAEPSFSAPDSMGEIAPLFETDTGLIDGLAVELRASRQTYLDRSAYNDCDRPMFRLLDVSARAPAGADGRTLRLRFLRVAEGVQPFTCLVRTFKSGAVVGTLNVEPNASPAQGVAFDAMMMWNAAAQRWAVYGLVPVEMNDFGSRATRLYREAALTLQ